MTSAVTGSGAVTQDMIGMEEATLFAEKMVIPAVGGAPLALATASMLMVIICSMKPEIEGQELADAIQDTTAYLVMRLAPPTGKAH